ncbi:MAG: 50S ribosomal protein L18 [Symbiobacteriia bacterium]
MLTKKSKNQARQVRHERVRQVVTGTTARPRLNVFRSNAHIYAQIIIDETGNTLVAASSLDPELKGQLPNTGNSDAAKAVGQLIAKRALEKGVKQVTFDRGGYLYHGRVAALATGAREAGLEF